MPGTGTGYAVAPVAYKVILEPGIGQFREFEPRRVHTRINSLGLFLVHKLTCGKRELATLDENRRAVGLLNPMREKKMKARTGGEKGRPRLVQKLESSSVRKKKKKNVVSGCFHVPGMSHFLFSHPFCYLRAFCFSLPNSGPG